MIEWASVQLVIENDTKFTVFGDRKVAHGTPSNLVDGKILYFEAFALIIGAKHH